MRSYKPLPHSFGPSPAVIGHNKARLRLGQTRRRLQRDRSQIGDLAQLEMAALIERDLGRRFPRLFQA